MTPVEQLRALVSQWRGLQRGWLTGQPNYSKSEAYSACADELDAVVAFLLAEERPQLEVADHICPWCGDPLRVLKPSGGAIFAEKHGYVWHPQCADAREAVEDRRPQEWQAERQGLHEYLDRLGVRRCDNLFLRVEELSLKPAVCPPEWREAALLKDRTRRAIRERVRAGESLEDVAKDYGVPVDFVKVLSEWELVEEGPQECQWTEDEYDSIWTTECGKTFQFTTDGPNENGTKFCCYCGGTLVAVLPAPPEATLKAQS